jgi:hypothetical protein
MSTAPHDQGTEGLDPGNKIFRPVYIEFAAQETVMFRL